MGTHNSDDTRDRLYKEVERACGDCTSNLVSLSGGLDSSIIAYMRAKNGKQDTAVAVVAEDFVSTDLTYCQMVAKELRLPLSIHNAGMATILDGVEETIRILGNFNDIEIRNSVVMYMAIKWAKDNGAGSIITGDGADELFAGYSFLRDKSGDQLQKELDRIYSTMHFPAQKIGESLGVVVESPFLDGRVVELARQIPPDQKTGDAKGARYGKLILRHIFDGLMLDSIVWRQKSPMQDGAGTSGLTGMFESVITDESFAEKSNNVKRCDGVTIRSKESMHYYEIYNKLFGSPVNEQAHDACPYCGHEVHGSRFCRMCGAFPIH